MGMDVGTLRRAKSGGTTCVADPLAGHDQVPFVKMIQSFIDGIDTPPTPTAGTLLTSVTSRPSAKLCMMSAFK